MKQRYCLLSIVSVITFATLFLNFIFSFSAYSQDNSTSLTQRENNYKHQMEILEKLKRVHQNELVIKPNPAKKSSSTIYFYDNMEGGINNWTTEIYTNTIHNLWHQTSSAANSPSKSWWCGVEGQSYYSTGRRIHNALISPTIDLTGANGFVVLTFAENYYTEKGWDFCMVDATSNGGGNWTPLRGLYGISVSGNSDGWKLSQLDISQFAGSHINIRFRFDTGDSLFNDFPGWFVDDVIIYDRSGTISGTVFFDLNQNSSFETDEPGIQKWVVRGTGPVTLQTPTRQFGNYSLRLPQGDYLVDDIPQVGWTSTYPLLPHPLFTLVSPDTFIQDVDFGYYRQTSKISGMKFNDINRNGIKDATEPGVPDLEIYLVSEYDIQTTLTNSEGDYSFYITQPATYYISEEWRQNWVQTYPPNQTWTLEVLDFGLTYENVDFGNYFLEGANSIFGQKFNDVNQNGVKDRDENGLQGWEIRLSGPVNKSTYTNEYGNYEFTNIPYGEYILIEVQQNGWQQTYPSTSQWTLNLAGDSTVVDVDFGNYFVGLFTFISGQKFNDANRDGIKDLTEEGLFGWRIILSGPITQSTTTDSSGFYKFSNLPGGRYFVSEERINGWRQSFPQNIYYEFILSSDTSIINADFGNYEVLPGSITGLKFNDRNANGIQEAGELGLAGFKIFLRGNNLELFTTTNSEGNYSFTGLWSSNYNLWEEMLEGWLQTFPGHYSSHNIFLDYEQNRTNVNFGNFQEVYQTEFRTFTPESLALACGILKKPVPLKPYKVEYIIHYMNNDVKEAKGIFIKFKIPIYANLISVNKPSNIEFVGTKGINILFKDLLQPNDSVIVHGFGTKGAPQLSRHQWTYIDNSNSVWTLDINYILNTPRLYMPNAINVLALVGTDLKVGLGGSHSVVHKNYKDITKSLVDKNLRMHIGEPRSLYKFSDNRMISRQLRYLTPTKGQNRLFAQSIAFKVNIQASKRSITPKGFGELIFDEGTGSSNPLNNLSLNQIASKLDSFMTLVSIPRIDSLLLDSTLRMINNAFSGTIDTLSFGNVLRLKGVRPIFTVPFLKLDSTVTLLGSPDNILNDTEMPDNFVLYQNYPNPFNPSTVIGFYLPAESYVTLKIFNTLGQLVTTVINNEKLEHGYNEVEVFTSYLNLSSGIYYYQLVCNSFDDEGGNNSRTFSAIRKMVLIK